MKKRLLSLMLAFVLAISFFPIRGLAIPLVVSDETIGVSDVLIEEHNGSYEQNSNNGTSDYRQWAQGDSRWGSTRLGSSSYTMSSSGCLVTAITKMIIQAGLKDSGSFNPGTMVNWLNSNSGFDSSGNLYWAKPATYSGMTNYGNLVSYGSYSSSGNNGQIITWINQGYHIVLNVNNGGHWIAVDEAKTLSTGKVYIMDSLLNSANADVALADRYSTFNLAHAYKGGQTASPSCTITFDANGGTGSMKNQTVKYGDVLTLAPNTFTRSGYIFAGWNAKRSDNTWFVKKQGWLTESEISSGGYSKHLYTDGWSGDFDDSWTSGSGGYSFTLYAQWMPVYNTYLHLNYSGKNYLVESDFSNGVNSTHWGSRDTSVSEIFADTNQTHNGYNTLKIVNYAVGSINKDMFFETLTNNRAANGYLGDSKAMVLSFWAKASKNGTGIHLRWGYEGTDEYRSISLSTEWEYYTIRMDKDTGDGSSIHPYIDAVGTVWLAELQLEDGTVATEFSPESESVYEILTATKGVAYKLPEDPVRDGYTFAGWYTAKEDGTRIMSSDLTEDGHRYLYARWIEKGCQHNYIAQVVEATCIEPAHTVYTCSICGDVYTVYNGNHSEWSTTKPEDVDENLIETKLQYRYADKETTTSYEPSLSGWTQVGGEWQQSGTGSVTYVKSWPSGFLTSHSLYGTYNKTPKSASETNTDKTAINSDNVTGYLYYHWCRGVDQPNGPINRTTKPTKQSEFVRFCAFYSTDDPYTKQMDTSDNSVVFANRNCCNDSHWYFFTPVNTQNYTTYRKLFTHERWGEWSDWSDTVYTAGSSRKVENRTLYRAVEVELGDHDYQNGYCTVCGAEDPDYNFVPVILGVADVSATPGDTVTIPVTISDNTGFAGFTLCIDYNESVMTLTNISKGNLLNNSESGAFTKNVSGKTINWVDSANIMGDGELMKLTFTIDGNAAPGSYNVELSLKNGNSNNFVDENSRAIHVEFENGIVTVQKPATVVTLEKIEVATKPTKTVYQIGEALDTSGLSLKATYSDGTTKNITSGFTVSGFDSASAGTKTVTVSYEGKKTTFTVTVKQEEIDPDAPKLVIASVNAAAGETVTVEARLEKNPGISSFSVKIDYDTTRLKLESAEFGTEISTGAFVNYNLPYIAFVRSGDCEGDVVLVTLTFTVLQDAEEGDAYVTMEYNEGDIANSAEEDVNFTVVSGHVTVVDYMPGDINGDGKVNSKDLTRLLKYISHEDVEVNEAALDVNGDGKVNSKDLTRLLKYISHEDVEIH